MKTFENRSIYATSRNFFFEEKNRAKSCGQLISILRFLALVLFNNLFDLDILATITMVEIVPSVTIVRFTS